MPARGPVVARRGRALPGGHRRAAAAGLHRRPRLAGRAVGLVPLPRRCALVRHGAGAAVVRYLERDARCAFEVAPEAPPYRGVRGQGDSDRRGAARAARCCGIWLVRYLGTADTPLGRWLLARAAEEVAIRIAPGRLSTWDYRARMGA